MVTLFFPKFLSALLLSCLLIACADEQLVSKQTSEEVLQKTVAKKPKTTNTYDLSLNQSLTLDDVKLEFMQLANDSRCAKGTECVWAGNAQVILLASNKDSAQTLMLNTNGEEGYPRSATFSGFEIKLLDLTPYPAVNVKIDPSQRVAKLAIKKAPAVSDAVIIDVRSAEEYQAGHYPSAINLQHTDIENTISSLNLPTDTEIIVYCRSGRRSGIAKETLEKLGYSKVTNGINQDKLHQKFGTSVNDQ
ncbi:rhodanese-like domain-containing protein [Kangiella sp. TOML190]|uniref:rhodanese-like domain-containing protein n=1 Tax=Kangiella sp. TOML190 TaxID=2931351 RepID=UPI00203BAF03|nr:rhodanese-like domain-containing protein [Kangiella sp. TOML190]